VRLKRAVPDNEGGGERQQPAGPFAQGGLVVLGQLVGISQIYKGATPVAAVAPPAPIIITIPSPWAPVAPTPPGTK
jgi:hypothetical protein